MYGIDEAAASRHVMDITVENHTVSTASRSGWRVTARLPWRLLQGGGGVFTGDEPAQDILVSATRQLPLMTHTTLCTDHLRLTVAAVVLVARRIGDGA